MQAISVRCPECNAIVDTAGGDQVTCTYCGAKARVQRRTQFFQRPMPLPPMRPTDPQAIAIASPSRAPILIIVGVTFGVLVVAGVAIGMAGRSAAPTPGTTAEAAATPAGAPATPPYWRGGPPLVRDLDGDGIDDVIGVRRYLGMQPDAMSIFALSGKDGHVVWETPSLGKYGDVYTDPIQLAGDVVLRADRVANLIGYSAKDGKQLWTQAMGEVVKQLCDGRVQTADDKWWTLDTATGAHTEVPPAKKKHAPPPHCGLVQVVGIGNEKTTNIEIVDEHPEVPNMSVAKLFAHGDAALPAIATGYRQPGTAVSMLAGLAGAPKWDKVVWVGEVAAADVLRAQLWGDDTIALDDDAVAALYTMGPSQEQATLTLFARADGKRRWAVPFAKLDYEGSPSFTGIGLTRDAVIVAMYGEIRSYARADGTLRWRVGKG